MDNSSFLKEQNEQLKKKIKEYEEREKIREIEKKLNLKYYIKRYIVEKDLNVVNLDKVMDFFSNHTYYFGVNGVNLFKVIKEYGWELLEKTFYKVFSEILNEKEEEI